MGKPLLEQNPYLDKCFFYGDEAGFLHEVTLMREIRRRRFNVAIDFMNNNRSALYAYASGADIRLSYDGHRNLFYTRTLPKGIGDTYVVREKLRFLNALNIEATETPMLLPQTAQDAAVSAAFFDGSDTTSKQRPRVVFSPTHRREVRRWPLRNYALVADRIASQWNAEIIWLWGPGEGEVIDKARALCGAGRGRKAPPTNLREAGALLSRCDLFVGNSNGLSHVAVATDCCSLQIHGPTRAASWSPLNRRHRAVEPAASARDSRPISLVSVEQVWSELMSMQVEVATSAATRTTTSSSM